ncbi:sialidase family protein [Bacillus sp. SJS]|uniref:sialidase family protein n=1 Tax=Bacillus sp. SJS TaxID=1423321 RepID=UPI000A736E6F|nr:sialidase family protein [Bacillus sp. SJS]
MPIFNFQVTPDGLPKFEPSIAVNLLSTNFMVAVATDNSTGLPRTGLYRSVDGGATWSNSILPLPAPFTGAEAAMVAYVFPATFVVSAHAFPGAESGTTLVYKSTDNGVTFSNPVVVGPGYGTYINNDETNITADNSQSSPYLGNIYVTYNHQFNVQNIGGSVAFFNRSIDGGNTFQTPVLLSDEAEQVERPDVTVGFTGNVYAGWITTDPVSQFDIRRSLDGGATFEPTVIVSDVVPVPTVLPVPGYAFRVLTFANLGTDNSVGINNGSVYAVWQDFRQGYSDVFLSKSSDEGLTWSTPISVTNAIPGSQNFFPAIDVDPLIGTINIIYYSNQLDGFNLDVFTARSTDGGQTFVNQRITSTSFNPNGTSPTPVPLIGDYIDIACVPAGGYIGVWTDTRTGFQNIFAGYNTDPV